MWIPEGIQLLQVIDLLPRLLRENTMRSCLQRLPSPAWGRIVAHADDSSRQRPRGFEGFFCPLHHQEVKKAPSDPKNYAVDGDLGSRVFVGHRHLVYKIHREACKLYTKKSRDPISVWTGNVGADPLLPREAGLWVFLVPADNVFAESGVDPPLYLDAKGLCKPYYIFRFGVEKLPEIEVPTMGSHESVSDRW